MQPTSEKAAVAMEHLLPHEVAERELEMQEAAEIKERAGGGVARGRGLGREESVHQGIGGGVPTRALVQPLLRVLQP